MPDDGIAPYLSIVATSRNDDHGGNLLGRMQIFIDGLDYQMRRVGLPAELVLVEWNPPADRALLADALRWPRRGGPLSVRIVTVPPERHAALRYADTLPLFQMIAKNVGVRRAKGTFVLCTNVDILLSDALADFLAKRELRAARSYRADRCDVPASPPDPADPDAILRWCERETFRIATPAGVVAAEGVPWSGGRIAKRRRQPLNSLAYRWRRLRAIRRHGLDASYNVASLEAFRPFVGEMDPVEKSWRGAIRHSLRNRARARSLPPIHAPACGDFTVMAASDWARLRGYPEFEAYSWHLDSLFLQLAAHRGIEEVRLPHPAVLYHLEQSAGAAWTPEGEDALFARLEQGGIPRLSDNDYVAMAARLAARPEDWTFGPKNWGFAGEALPERRVA